VGPENHVLDGVKIATWEEEILGVVLPTDKKHWQSLLRCMQQEGSFNCQFNGMTARLPQPTAMHPNGKVSSGCKTLPQMHSN